MIVFQAGAFLSTAFATVRPDAFQPGAFQQDGFQTSGTITATTYQPSGGAIWWSRYERQMARIRALRRKRIEDEEEAERIEDATTRQIALLLKAQEAKDGERAEVERLRSLAKGYDGADERMARALDKVANARSLAAASALQREVARMHEEEDFLMSAIMAVIDD